MHLRNADRATVDRSKVVEYLLNAAHPDNGGKAQFFASLGFSVAEADALIAALRAVGVAGTVVEHNTTAHGEKYVVDGVLAPHTGEGDQRVVRTIWIVDRGADTPRLVTAYPGKEVGIRHDKGT